MGAGPRPESCRSETLRVQGIVQGVGFRPTVWRLASECGLVGWVRNDAAGVLMEIWGDAASRDGFVERLQLEAPPLARIDAIVRTPGSEGTMPEDFRILASTSGTVRTGVAPDAAVCGECLAEIWNPADRRYRYPFINCTHCGPRLSIVRAVPYDRANTSMASFPLCTECRCEYDDPANRRFHAQPNACPACGPRLWLDDRSGAAPATDDPIRLAAQRLREGRIVAIKGIGGFHLACDASNAQAVAELRRRKRRYAKPFALMARDVAMVERYARISGAERAALLDRAAPIVLLETRCAGLAPEIAPGQGRLGFMLPYAPLHHLLLQELDEPLVMTSGNRSDEPQCVDNGEARSRLGGIADAFLLHDRDIVNRLDDSVVQIADGKARLLRRGRGYAPASLPLPPGMAGSPSVLAMGGELKNTFCLLQDDRLILSQHLGDLENAPTLKDYRRSLGLYRDLFQHRPAMIAVDRHPDYLSTQHGQALAETEGLPCVPVQHHHAHIAACLAEHGWPVEGPKVLGIALDGLGMGEDGALWGGEFLLCDYADSRRLAGFVPVPMLGGTAAMREPWRNAYAHLRLVLGWETLVREYGHTEIVRFLQSKPLATLERMWTQRLNSPPASSCGRLFDAVAAIIDVCRDAAAYEGQAACELESLASPAFDSERERGYGYSIERDAVPWTLSWKPLWRGLLDDLSAGLPLPILAARFHHGLAQAVAEVAAALCREQDISNCILSGGVFQNRLLLEETARRLRAFGLDILMPKRVPANDGGLALGQAVIAAMRELRRMR